jgi:LAS superfamily LD-carboxypeptidase LdcB
MHVRSLLILCLLAGLAHADAVHTVTGYRKGRPFKLQVTPIQWAEVEVRTARAFLAMREAAAEDGVELVILSGFRSYRSQAALYAAYRGGYGNLAARPGHSNHQSGSALDLYLGDGRTYAWLAAHAHQFGFRRTVKSEPWHWDYASARRRRR